MRRGSTASSTPSLDPVVIARRLAELLRADPLGDPGLLSRLERLRRRHLTYCRTIAPIWTPGVVISHEMRLQAEAYLPLRELVSLLQAILRRLCLFPRESVPLFSPPALSWPDMLARLPHHLQEPDPWRLCHRLLAEPEHRPALIFALFIPRHHGGGFDRYPGQMAFLTPWLQQLRSRQARIRCLDAACGSGEGTWELALALMAADFAPDDVLIHGTSLDTLELFAAGHGFFPHNLLHQEAVRQRISPALAAGFGNAIRFFPEDLLQPGPVDALYDLILCNGAIGGPFIHEPAQMETALKGLAGRLAPGGVLMMANRFHGGWGKTVTKGDIAHLARRVGLEARWGDEGVVAVKRPATTTTISEG